MTKRTLRMLRHFAEPDARRTDGPHFDRLHELILQLPLSWAVTATRRLRRAGFASHWDVRAGLAPYDSASECRELSGTRRLLADDASTHRRLIVGCASATRRAIADSISTKGPLMSTNLYVPTIRSVSHTLIQIGSSCAVYAQRPAAFRRLRPNFGRHRPGFARLEAQCGQLRAKFRPNSGRNRRGNSAGRRSKSARKFTDCGQCPAQIWAPKTPKTVEAGPGSVRTSFGRFRQISAKIWATLAEVDGLRPLLPRCRQDVDPDWASSHMMDHWQLRLALLAAQRPGGR